MARKRNDLELESIKQIMKEFKKSVDFLNKRKIYTQLIQSINNLSDQMTGSGSKNTDDSNEVKLISEFLQVAKEFNEQGNLELKKKPDNQKIIYANYLLEYANKGLWLTTDELEFLNSYVARKLEHNSNSTDKAKSKNRYQLSIVFGSITNGKSITFEDRELHQFNNLPEHPQFQLTEYPALNQLCKLIRPTPQIESPIDSVALSDQSDFETAYDKFCSSINFKDKRAYFRQMKDAIAQEKIVIKKQIRAFEEARQIYCHFLSSLTPNNKKKKELSDYELMGLDLLEAFAEDPKSLSTEEKNLFDQFFSYLLGNVTFANKIKGHYSSTAKLCFLTRHLVRFDGVCTLIEQQIDLGNLKGLRLELPDAVLFNEFIQLGNELSILKSIDTKHVNKFKEQIKRANQLDKATSYRFTTGASYSGENADERMEKHYDLFKEKLYKGGTLSFFEKIKKFLSNISLLFNQQKPK